MDPLDDMDDILNLEETYYAEGFALGKNDGRQAGLAEGRAMGLQRGFERFATVGRLHGRSVVWQSRLGFPPSEEAESRGMSTAEVNLDGPSQQFMAPATIGPAENNTEQELMEQLEKVTWKSLQQNPRLRKHVQLLYGLTEPESLSMANNEDDVAEFEDRFRRAVAKVGIIGKIVGEEVSLEDSQSIAGSGEAPGGLKGGRSEVGIEDVDILKVRH